jgi:copper homeostasis protein
MRLLLEVIACSARDASEAERGGAHRLEVVRALDRGGLTPPPPLVCEIRERVSLPLRVMVRERDGYEAGGAAEVDRLAALAQELASLRVDGLVAGWLRDGAIDVDAMDAVAAVAPGLPITFHHAFDELPDAAAALAALDRWPQVDRVLTSGGAGDWAERAARLGRYARLAGARTILAGGGVDAQAARVLARTPGVRELHAGRAVRIPPAADGVVDHRRVAALLQGMTG